MHVSSSSGQVRSPSAASKQAGGAHALLTISLSDMQVTCMDSRLIPENMFGFKLGDAEIIRNAGGRVNSDVIRFASHCAVPAVLLPLRSAA